MGNVKSPEAVVYYGPGPNEYCAPPYSAGGPIVHVWVPCFSGAGASLEVHFLDRSGEEVGVFTYTLSATAVGAFGLTRTGGSFLADRPETSMGYIAYVRGASALLGRCGSDKPHSSGGYIQDSATLPETLSVGEALAWCFVADSHGWDIRSAQGPMDVSNMNVWNQLVDGSTKSYLISASARRLYGIRMFTVDSAPAYAKPYDKATAAASSDTPLDVVGCPANSTAALGSGNNSGAWGNYIPLSNGLSVRIVTGIANADDTAPTNAKTMVSVYWS